MSHESTKLIQKNKAKRLIATKSLSQYWKDGQFYSTKYHFRILVAPISFSLSIELGYVHLLVNKLYLAEYKKNLSNNHFSLQIN